MVALTARIRSPIRPIAATAAVVEVCTPAICPLISSVARAVCAASAFTSEATTAKPLPAAPARADSMVALSASRLVCSAIWRMSPTTSPMRPAASASSPISVFMASDSAAAVATRASAWSSWVPISPIEAESSSAALATVWTLAEVSCEPRSVSATATSASAELAAISPARSRIAPVLAVRAPFRTTTCPRNAAMARSRAARRRVSSAAPALCRPSSSRVRRPAVRSTSRARATVPISSPRLAWGIGDSRSPAARASIRVEIAEKGRNRRAAASPTRAQASTAMIRAATLRLVIVRAWASKYISIGSPTNRMPLTFPAASTVG